MSVEHLFVFFKYHSEHYGLCFDLKDATLLLQGLLFVYISFNFASTHKYTFDDIAVSVPF